eukprot:4420268-Pleurochrysis_carterae.AAC.1
MKSIAGRWQQLLLRWWRAAFVTAIIFEVEIRLDVGTHHAIEIRVDVGTHRVIEIRLDVGTQGVIDVSRGRAWTDAVARASRIRLGAQRRLLFRYGVLLRAA